MSVGNTSKDGTGFTYWHLVDSDGNLYVRQAKQSGHSIIQLTADGNINANPGTLYALVVAGAGVTAADTVVIKDGGAGGTVRLTIVFEAANQTIVVPLPVPATFTTDIYVDVTISGGAVYVTGVYD